MDFDIVIKNGRIIDGIGNPCFRADVGIKNSKIAKIGRLTGISATRELDATGLVVSPGYIDTHSHSDLMLLVEPEAEQKIMQGITTEILGQDGLSVAPLPVPIFESWKKRLAGLLGTPKIEWDWVSVGDYFQRLERSGTATNVAYLVPHGAVRACVMQFEDRSPTTKELAQMQDLVDQSMRAGAIGLSTGLIYPPCTYAKGTEELITLCKLVGAFRGVFVIHMRNESDFIMEALNETIEISNETGVAVHISHLKVAGRRNWDKIDHVLKRIDEARVQGIDITFDQYPYIAGSTMLAAVLPPWVMVGGTEEALKRLKDPKEREKIKKDIDQGIPGWENIVGRGDWNDILVSFVPSEKNRQFMGKRIPEIANLVGKDPADTAFDLLIEEDLVVSMVTFWGSESLVYTAMRHPQGMFATDGLLGGKPHPRVYGTYPRILGKCVREDHIIALEEAVRKMTSFPAQRFGLRDRGLIREGMAGDITIFDPDHVLDKATFEDPIQFPEGIKYVLVNGVVVKEGNHHMGSLPGRVLRHQR